MNGPIMYSNNGMMPGMQAMYSSPAPPGYINPVAANMMLNNANQMNSAYPANYVNPNYLKMMNGGVANNNNTIMNNRPLFN
jgi:hypothetical protein